jgi:hypothetical protein
MRRLMGIADPDPSLAGIIAEYQQAIVIRIVSG